MKHRNLARNLGRILTSAAVITVLAILTLAVIFRPDLVGERRDHRPLLLAPMIGGLADCLFEREDLAQGAAKPHLTPCRGPGGSASAWVESTLAPIFGEQAENGPYRLGFTLQVPLLHYFVKTPSGWVLDHDAIARTTETVRTTNRPVILYFFSNHFELPTALEAELFADVQNRSETANGPMSVDSYYGTKLYPWSVAKLDNPVTRYREVALQALADALCKLPESDRKKIAGATVLGELHQFFPGFESQAGFGTAYQISDYSPASKAQFHAFLRTKFGSVQAMNVAIGGNFRSFDAVHPPHLAPEGEGQAEPLLRLDAHSSGRVPISGWVHDGRDGGKAPVWVHLRLNGQPIAQVLANQGRQDVLSARPDVGTANVGWRYDLNHRWLANGQHSIEAHAQLADGSFVPLGTRRVQVYGQQAYGVQKWKRAPPPAPLVDAAVPAISGHWDLPRDGVSVSFNPMAMLWQEFRALQVARYFDHFASVLKRSCLKDRPVYTHQILPEANPDWDAEKFAASELLKPRQGVDLGISLYGDAAQGPSFFTWLGKSGHSSYGVTEFHPLRGMSEAELWSVFEGHRAHGAQFVSFFMELGVAGAPPPPIRNPFSFDKENEQFGSAALYQAVQQRLVSPRPGGS